MKVVDADREKISEFCGAVVDHLNIRGRESVLVVGIRSGGVPLAEALHGGVSGPARLDLSFVRCSRPSTKNKKNGIVGKLFRTLIRLMPRGVLNFLRNLEHSVLSRKRTPDRHVESEISDYSGYQLIVVIDDAVDSGHSLGAVMQYLQSELEKSENYDAELRSAVYVVTQEDPVFEPDYSFERGVLVRFPWALDA